ncbi:MAG: hypothetical protein KDI82_01690 [Gammaproteobacteria bacterium]|nr:hypothetical protein [Gammaproteobacteria bacterium]
MVARLFFFVPVVAIGIAILPLQTTPWAAQAAGAGAYVATERSQFRPWSYQPDSATARSRTAGSPSKPRVSATVRASSREMDLFTDRAGARKAIPVTRGKELGLQFRPDDSAGPYGQSAVPAVPPGVEQDQSQFRPLQPRRKPTYEELEMQADSQFQGPVLQPVLPYPPMPTLPPRYPGMVPPPWMGY